MRLSFKPYTCPGLKERSDTACRDSQQHSPLQHEHVKCRTRNPDTAAHDPDDCELLAHADLHDLQRVAVHSDGAWSGPGLLPLRVAQVCGGRHNRALPLVPVCVCLSVCEERVVNQWLLLLFFI